MVRGICSISILLSLGGACGTAAPPKPVTVEVAGPTSPPASSAPAETPSLDAACQRGTAQLLGSLRAKLDVTVWVTSGNPKLASFARALDDLFRGYERLAPGRLQHRMIEPRTPAELYEAKKAGLQEAYFGSTEGETRELRRGFLGIAFAYRGEKETIPILSPEQSGGLAFWVANKIREIHARADHSSRRIAVLTGKGEIALSEANLSPQKGTQRGPTMKGVLEQALPFYELAEVDLQGGKVELDGSADALVITQPDRDFTEKELRRIDQFLLRGKSVAIFAGAVNLRPSDEAMSATLDVHGLDKLLQGYGIDLAGDAVLDWASPARIKIEAPGAPVTLVTPAVTIARYEPGASEPKASLDPTFPGFFRLEELALPFPSTLLLHEDWQPGAHLWAVAKTSSRATAVTSLPLSLRPSGDLKPSGEPAPRVVAAALEGRIRSAFAGRPDPAIPAPADSAGRSRLLVIASPQFLANPWARAGNPPPMPPQMAMMGPIGGDDELQLIAQPYAQYLTATILAFKNTLDWMTGDEDLIACSALLANKSSPR